MKKRKTALPVILLALAIIFIGAGAAMAVTSGFQTSDKYSTEMDTPELSIALVENGTEVSGEDALLKDLLGKDPSLKIGKIYDEKLAISNTDDADAYVRLTVKRYWIEDDNGKRADLSPALIKLRKGSGWVEDKSVDASPETRVFYYTKPLEGGKTSSPAITGIGLDTDVAKYIEQEVTETSDGKTITTTYTYNDIQFGIKADADAIQTHNAQDAAKSAWGVDISVSDNGTLKLK